MIDKKKAPELIAGVLYMLGENPTREGLIETPNRVVKSWGELYKGYGMEPKQILSTSFESDGYDQMVILKNIEFYSTCEHHMLPFFGKAHVAYIPKKRVVGLSKLARLVECYSRRLQIQERLTNQVVEALMQELKPAGAICVMEAKHFCMVARGVNKQNSVMTTSALAGVFKSKPAARAEFMSLIGKG